MKKVDDVAVGERRQEMEISAGQVKAGDRLVGGVLNQLVVAEVVEDRGPGHGGIRVEIRAFSGYGNYASNHAAFLKLRPSTPIKVCRRVTKADLATQALADIEKQAETYADGADNKEAMTAFKLIAQLARNVKEHR